MSEVVKLGPESAAFGIQVGDLIGATLWHGMCLECVDCRSSGPNFCTKMKVKGITVPGYFCEYTLVDPAGAVVIKPGENVNIAGLAPIFCAGVTVWDAIERAQLRVGETLAVVGAGGLGRIATRYAQALGQKVIVLDVRDESLIACKDEGIADEILNTTGLDARAVAGKVISLNGGGGVDVAIVTAGATEAYATAQAILKPEGKLIAVGLPREPVPINMTIFTHRCLRLVLL